LNAHPGVIYPVRICKFWYKLKNGLYYQTARHFSFLYEKVGLDLTIGLIHVIVQQTQKPDACAVTIEACAKVLPTEKSLVVSFWTFFQISRQIKKN